MKKPRSSSKPPPAAIGWREWVSLPELGIDAVKVKIDTGARSSALHAFDVETFHRRGKTMIRFKVHPQQRDSRTTVSAVAELLEYRRVKSSGGHETLRPVVLTVVQLLGQSWPIELTLVSRDAMGFRMLLGRQAVRGRFLVDPGKSYLGGKRPGSGAAARPPGKKAPKKSTKSRNP